jgi:cyclase
MSERHTDAWETTVTQVAPGVFVRKMEWEPKFLGSNQGWVIFKDFVLVIEASFPSLSMPS